MKEEVNDNSTCLFCLLLLVALKSRHYFVSCCFNDCASFAPLFSVFLFNILRLLHPSQDYDANTTGEWFPAISYLAWSGILASMWSMTQRRYGIYCWNDS
jgi:hypothetical protein